ncbi:MAG: Jag N-terminal domain-containing protein, partial [Spirochaetota bacterium]|nr:Jag N-terminal domain-containing protein [Spirochaetota bacterium]
MLVREFEGKTEKDAIKTALETLKLTEDQVTIEPVEEGKVGFFGFRNKKPVKIKVYYEEQLSSELSIKVKNFLITLVELMGLKANASIVQEDTEKIFISVSSAESG